METAMILLVGVLVSCGLYLMLERNLLRFIFGLILLSNGVNLLIVTAGRISRVSPPLIPDGEYAPVTEVANALPQALVLTAIVIGFGLTVFALALILRTYERLGTTDSDDLSAISDTEDDKDSSVTLPGSQEAPIYIRDPEIRAPLLAKTQERNA